MNEQGELKARTCREQGLTYMFERDPELQRARAAGANAFMEQHTDADAVVIFHPPDAAHLETSVPIVIIHDATWRQFTTSYPGYRAGELAQNIYESGFEFEREAFEKASLIVFFNSWAASAAAREYPLLKEKMAVISPGASWTAAPEREEVARYIQRRVECPPNLLFIGKDAYRKGLDIALGIPSYLAQQGTRCTLDVVGSTLGYGQGAISREDGLVTYHGHLRKDNPEQRASLMKLFAEATFHILPSRADCGSLAICDAAAYGVPSLSSGSGGIASLMSAWAGGVNVGIDATAERYANEIQVLIQDRASYVRLAREVRGSFDAGLRWSAFVASLLELMEDLPTAS